MHVEEIVARWGYFGVGLGAAIEGETIVITAGALAHKGLLSLPLVIAAAFVGSVVGDQIWFQIGRRYGKPFIDKRPSIQKRVARIDRWQKKFGNAFVVAFRFIYGMRMATPVFLGARNYPLKKFVALDLAGAALWSTVISSAGYLVGASLARVLHRAGKIEEIAIAAIVVTIGIVFVVREVISRKAAAKSLLPTSSHPAADPSASVQEPTQDP